MSDLGPMSLSQSPSGNLSRVRILLTKIAGHGAAFAIFVAAAIVATYPLVKSLATTVLEPHDTLQIAWLLAWNTKHLFSGLSTQFGAGVMYPVPDPLTNIEPMRGLLMPYAPIYWLSQNPILSFNLSALFGYAMSGFGVYLLLVLLLPKTVQAWWAALLAGLLFALSPWRVGRFLHLEQLSASWLALLILCLILYLETRRLPWLVGFISLTALQTLISYYYVVICGIVIAGTILFMLLMRRASARTAIVACGAAVIGLLVVHLRLALVYVENSSHQLIHPVEQAFFSLQTSQDFIASGDSLWFRQLLFGDKTIMLPTMERIADAGILTYLLVGLGLIGLYKSNSSYRKVAVACLAVVALSLALSLGPYIAVDHLRMPAPFTLLRAFPGVGSLRAPARLWQAALLGLAILAGMATWRFSKHLDTRLAVSAYVILCAIPVYSALKVPRPVYQISHTAAVFQWMRDSLPPNAIVLQLPLDVRADGWPGLGEARKMYDSLYHEQIMVNAYLAYVPAAQKRKYAVLSNFPEPTAMECLRDIGVTHILLNQADLRPGLSVQLRDPTVQNQLGLVSLYDDTDHMVLDVRDTGAAGKEETTARLRFSEGWYDLDQGPENWSYLSSGRGTIEIDDKFPEVLSFTADVSAVSPPDTIRIYIGGKLAWQGELAEAGPHQIGPISIPSKKGKTEIQIVNGKGPLHVGSDPRLLGFRLGNVKLNNNGVRVCQLQ